MSSKINKLLGYPSKFDTEEKYLKKTKQKNPEGLTGHFRLSKAGL